MDFYFEKSFFQYPQIGRPKRLWLKSPEMALPKWGDRHERVRQHQASVSRATGNQSDPWGAPTSVVVLFWAPLGCRLSDYLAVSRISYIPTLGVPWISWCRVSRWQAGRALCVSKGGLFGIEAPVTNLARRS